MLIEDASCSSRCSNVKSLKERGKRAAYQRLLE